MITKNPEQKTFSLSAMTNEWQKQTDLNHLSIEYAKIEGIQN